MVELVCVILYVIPRTAVLGGVLSTGVFGGAIAPHLRIGSSAFEMWIFPIMMGSLAWGGLWLRDGASADTVTNSSRRVSWPLSDL